MANDFYICVDIEAAGPVPGEYAMLSIGACLVDDISQSFYIELQPDRANFDPEAMAVHGLSIEALKAKGAPPQEAMRTFAGWVKMAVPEGRRPVFVALNAPFDWMFVNDYFHRYLVENPFGHSALDIKAYFMGQTGVEWSETSMRHISSHLLRDEKHLAHNALLDAQDQALIFQRMMNQSNGSP